MLASRRTAGMTTGGTRAGSWRSENPKGNHLNSVVRNHVCPWSDEGCNYFARMCLFGIHASALARREINLAYVCEPRSF